MSTSRFARSLRPRVTTLALLLAAGAPLSAQEIDPRWLPWVGCWEPVAEEPTGDQLCVRPAGTGVEVTELVDGAVTSAQTLVADGRAYPITAEGCTGTRSAEFSTDGKRLFTLTEQACDGDVPRASTGLIAMVSPSEWIDVQAANEEGEAMGWARRYRVARGEAPSFTDGAAARRARAAAAAQVDVDDVIEATRAVDPEAVRTWIAELQDPFDLDARRLLRLADAGVPGDVIDVMVAVSYPDRFQVDRDGDVERLATRDDPPPDRRGRYGRRRGGFFGPVYDPYRDYGYGYGWGNGWYGPGVVIVVPRRDPEPNARVVKGRGYTRGNGGSGSAPAANQGTQPQADEKPAPKPEPQPEPAPERRRAVPRGG